MEDIIMDNQNIASFHVHEFYWNKHVLDIRMGWSWQAFLCLEELTSIFYHKSLFLDAGKIKMLSQDEIHWANQI